MENMNLNLTNATSLELAEAAVKVLLKMKGIAVKLFCVKESSSITDYYITVTGRSKTHVASLADEVVYQLEEGGRNVNRVEGKRGDSWILVDYIDVIVQIFDSESRSFYDFDRLLSQSELVDISHIDQELDNEN